MLDQMPRYLLTYTCSQCCCQDLFWDWDLGTEFLRSRWTPCHQGLEVKTKASVDFQEPIW